MTTPQGGGFNEKNKTYTFCKKNGYKKYVNIVCGTIDESKLIKDILLILS